MKYEVYVTVTQTKPPKRDPSKTEWPFNPWCPHKAGDRIVFVNNTVIGHLCSSVYPAITPYVMMMANDGDTPWGESFIISCGDDNKPVFFKIERGKEITKQPKIERTPEGFAYTSQYFRPKATETELSEKK